MGFEEALVEGEEVRDVDRLGGDGGWLALVGQLRGEGFV